MKKTSLTFLISLGADIIGWASGIKELLMLIGVEESQAEGVNKIWVYFFSTALLLSIIGLCYIIDKHLKDAGTRGIRCKPRRYISYKVTNKHCSLLSTLHRDIYHKLTELRNRISVIKRGKNKEERTEAIAFDEIHDSVLALLDSFHTALYMTFSLDVSISLFLLSETSDKKTILSKELFLRSKKENKKGKLRDDKLKYVVEQDKDQEASVYAQKARTYDKKYGSGQYVKNSVFDYILSASKHSWMSNNLSLDMNRNEFFSSSPNYNKYYKSMAAFAVKPPQCEDGKGGAIRGIVTFDSLNTGVFSESECSLIMGLMAHILYDVLENLKMN